MDKPAEALRITIVDPDRDGIGSVVRIDTSGVTVVHGCNLSADNVFTTYAGSISGAICLTYIARLEGKVRTLRSIELYDDLLSLSG